MNGNDSNTLLAAILVALWFGTLGWSYAGVCRPLVMTGAQLPSRRGAINLTRFWLMGALAISFGVFYVAYNMTVRSFGAGLGPAGGFIAVAILGMEILSSYFLTASLLQWRLARKSLEAQYITWTAPTGEMMKLEREVAGAWGTMLMWAILLVLAIAGNVYGYALAQLSAGRLALLSTGDVLQTPEGAMAVKTALVTGCSISLCTLLAKVCVSAFFVEVKIVRWMSNLLRSIQSQLQTYVRWVDIPSALGPSYLRSTVPAVAVLPLNHRLPESTIRNAQALVERDLAMVREAVGNLNLELIELTPQRAKTLGLGSPVLLAPGPKAVLGSLIISNWVPPELKVVPEYQDELDEACVAILGHKVLPAPTAVTATESGSAGPYKGDRGESFPPASMTSNGRLHAS